MKRKALLGILIGFIAGFVWGVNSHAADTETLLIDKLTQVFLKLPEGSATKGKITLRLADLHAERGRLQAKAELEKGCIQCGNGEKDRKKAIEYYQYVLPNIQGEQRQRVMVQVGHLYEVLGQSEQAIGFYKKVLDINPQKGASEAHFSLAEIYFKRRNFQSAYNHYRKALTDDSFARRGLATFRSAWCQYNMGEIAQAIIGLEKILTNDKLLSRNSTGSVNVDEDFRAEVAKDYTVFLAHDSQIGMKSVERVYRLSPQSARIENVMFLAKELERLGRTQVAEQAWDMVVEKTESPEIRMEGLVYLAGLQIKNGSKDKILAHLSRAFQNWNSMKQCSDQRVCDELKKRVRNIVFDWNRSEKKAPSESLIEAYKGYFSVESQDLMAFELASQAAILAKQYGLAYQWNANAMALAETDTSKESLLLKRVEIAELAKNPEWLTAAQTMYLQKSPTQSKSSEISYQLAQKAYEAKDYKAAAKQFHSLAVNSKTPQNLRIQAAEMSLDTLVLLKDDARIEAWGKEYAGLFTAQKARFMGLASQSVLSQSAQLADGESEKAWQTLQRFDVKSANAESKKTYLTNRVILARKLKKFSEMDQSLTALLGLGNLSKDERTFALENRVWLAELQLNFQQAFESYKKLNSKNWLELARLADLAEKPSEIYYYNFLKEAQDSDLALSICLKLIRDAKAFGARQKICKPHLQKNPALFSNLLLEIYAGKMTTAQLEGLLKRNGLAGSAVARVIQRDLLIKKGQSTLSKLEKHKLDGRTSRVATSLQRRMSLIGKFESIIQKATTTEDWLPQTLFLTELHQQYIRFYNELLALPTPQDLSAEEQQQYLSLLSQQAAPYKDKADQIQFKLTELWKNQAAIDQVIADFHHSSQQLQAILGPQVELLKKIVGPENGDGLFLVYKSEQKKSVPTLANLEMARQQVKSSPFDKEALRRLIRLETARGYQPMIIYLNSRLSKVDQGFEMKEKSL